MTRCRSLTWPPRSRGGCLGGAVQHRRPHQALGMAVPADRFSTAHAQAEQELLPPRLPAVNLAPVPPLPGGPPQATAEQSRFAPRIAAVLWSSSGWSRPAGTYRSRPGSSGSGRPVPGMVWARLLDLAYNSHRPHQALQQEPPLRESGHAVDITARIERRQVLGGLTSEYRRAA